jgi:hypothetical protein
MKTSFKLALLAIIALAIAVYHAHLTRACNPGAFMPEPIFVNTLHPDLPIGPYAMGNLGVIEPTYASIYLYVAYRNLAGVPIRPAEQTVLWDNDRTQLTDGDWQEAWFSAVDRAKRGAPLSPEFFTPGSQPIAGIYRQIALNENGSTYYSQYLNCQQDAFHNAVSTLKRLVEQFGETSPVVQDWIEAQRTVFGNCKEGNAIPSPLPPGAPAIARAARAYQIAAAHFYAGDYDEAASDFRAIAQDMSSPWSTIAPYLVARSLVRKATMGESPKPDLATLAKASAQIDSVLQDPRMAQYHHAAESLRGFIEFRLHPQQRLVELANNLTRSSDDPNLTQDATDFKLLCGSVYSSPADVRSKSDLLDWMLTLRFGGAEAYEHSFKKWESTRSDAWLIAALTNADPTSPRVSELLAAASQVPTASRAYDSVTFQSLRLMMLQGKDNEVRERLAHLTIHHVGFPPPNADTPPSTVNLFLAMRFELAQNLDGLLENAPRVPATITTKNSSQQLPEPIWRPQNENPFDPDAARLDSDALVVFNRYLPVAILAKVVQSAKLPENLRRETALAAWMRAALLGNADVARRLAPAVEGFEPELRSSVQAYNSVATPPARRFAAALAALRFPGLRPFITLERGTPIDKIDDFRDNWWGTLGPVCGPPNQYAGLPGYPPAPRWPEVGAALQVIYPGGRIKPPEFLGAKDRADAAREWQSLIAMGPAPNYLSAQVIAWAKARPSDPDVPEALGLAVKSTRFGCTDAKTGQFSKTAFDLLHSRYPKSRWAQETRYWFKM